MDETQRADINNRLWNWGAWARSGSGLGTRACGSAERKYIAPRDDDNTRADRIREPINVPDAERVEKAVCSVRDKRMRKLMVLHYVDMAPPITLAKLLNVRPMLVEPAILTAQGAVMYWLEHAPIRAGLQSRRKSNMYQETAPQNVSSAP
jgi:hypothetical protein